MQRILTVFLTFSLVSCISLIQAQQKKRIPYSELDVIKGLFFQPNTIDPYSGLAFEEFPDGKKQMEVPIRNGKIHGKVKQWERNGQKIGEMEYEMGVKVNTEREWYSTGKEKLLVSYQAGVPHGVCTEWHKKGTKKSEGYFEMGLEEGEHFWWYPSGKKDQFIFYKKGKANGAVKSWHMNGQLKMEANYLEGKTNGKMLEWYANGEKKSESNYEDNLQIGEALYWAQDGRLTGKKVFIDGKLVKEFNYGSGSMKTNKGYVQVYNFLNSHFSINIEGKEDTEYIDWIEDITYTVDGMLLQLFTLSTSKLDVSKESTEDEIMDAFLAKEKSFIEEGTKEQIQITKNKAVNDNGVNYIHWHFISPSSKDKEQKARTIQEEHYISFLCNNQVLSVYSVVSNSDEPKLVNELIFKAANSLILSKEPINIFDFRE